MILKSLRSFDALQVTVLHFSSISLMSLLMPLTSDPPLLIRVRGTHSTQSRGETQLLLASPLIRALLCAELPSPVRNSRDEIPMVAPFPLKALSIALNLLGISPYGS